MPELSYKTKIGLACTGFFVLLGLTIVFSASVVMKNRGEGFFGGGLTSPDRNYIDAFGTAASPYTLTNTYVTSSRLKILGLANVAFAGTYTPRSYGSVSYILVERSIDNGQNYYPYATITPETGDVLLNTSGTSTTSGSPFIVPGNVLFTAASGTAIPYSFDISLAADYVRVSTKEVTTSTAGTINIEVMSVNN